MARPRPALNTDDLIQRYDAGESAASIAASVGIAKGSFYKRLKVAGHAVRGNRRALDDAAIVARYVAGDSEKKISDDLGVDRLAIRRRLIEANVQPRGRSEAERLKWSKLKSDPVAVARQVAAANAACRGRAHSQDEIAKRALSAFAGMSRHIGRGEDEIFAALCGAGLNPVRQRPFGRYNLDLALEEPRVAVEVVGTPISGPPSVRQRLFDRTKHLIDSGWCVLFVYVGPLWGGRMVELDRSFVAEEVIAFANRFRRNESARRGYRVIRGDGKPTAMLRRYLDDLPDV